MALLINNATPAGTDSVSAGDNEIRDLKTAIQDIFGVPNNTTIAAAVMGMNASGELTSLARLNGLLKIGASTDAYVATQGMLVDQGTNDNFIAVYRSTDVTQPMTDVFSASTYAALKKADADAGGAQYAGVAESASATAVLINAYTGSAPSGARTSSVLAAITLSAYKSDGGTGVTPYVNTENIVAVSPGGPGNNVLLVDASGRLTLQPGNSGVTAHSFAQNLIVEGITGASGVGMSFLSEAAATQQFYLKVGDATSGDNDIGEMSYDFSNNRWSFYANATQTVVIDSTRLFINDTANGDMTSGLTVNGLTSTGEHVALKTSIGGSAHGMTTLAETDTYTTFKHDATSGGTVLESYSFSDRGLSLAGHVTTGSTVKNQSARAPVMTTSRLKAGTTSSDMGANESIFVVRDNTNARFIVDAEGDLHVDGSGSLATFDAYNDVELVTALKGLMTTDLSFKERYRDWIDAHAPLLAAHGVITYNEDGHHFVSYKGSLGLIFDTIRQMAERIIVLEERSAWIGTRSWRRLKSRLHNWKMRLAA